MRVAFMGTPEFAVAPLKALIDAGYNVIGVFTQPDRPAGRGNKLTPCPVKVVSLEAGLPVFQFEKIRRREGREALENLSPDIVVTAAFGQILSERILAIPPLGTVNVHASLLPAYRGPAPINWCIAMGEKVTGVTTMFTDAGIDTGDMILKCETPIGDTETAEELSVRLSAMGAELLIKTLRLIESGNCPRTKQDESSMSYYPMLTREMGKIDWTMSAEEICCKVRGFHPWPGTYTTMPDGSVMKLWRVRPHMGSCDASAGEVVISSAREGLFIACGSGMIEALEIQAPGSRKMEAKAYLMGKKLPVGMLFGKE